MNTYRTKFFSQCPSNGVRIEYNLEIEAQAVILVEDILAHVSEYQTGYHEAIADSIHARFGGSQTIVANHHGVEIQTTRK